MADGEGARQIIGKHQQDGGRAEAGCPWTVFGPGENCQQGADDHHQRATQGIAEDQAVEWEAQSGQRLVAGARSVALGQQVLMRGFNGGKQPRP
ncbi:hypothetical protein D3C85_1593320 [compost metagenome]